MTLEQTLVLLKNANVPEYLYAVNGLGGGDCSCIAFEGGVWRTFYSERGSRWDEVEHPREAAACEAFKAAVAKGYEEYFGKPPAF